MRALALVLLAAALPSAGWTCEGLKVETPWLREAPPGAGVLAAYMELHNAGDVPLRVRVGEAEDFHHAMLHETVITDGRASMRHVDALALAPGERASLAPGGMHVMLHGPRRGLRAGDHSPITLECQSGATIVTLPVRKATP